MCFVKQTLREKANSFGVDSVIRTDSRWLAYKLFYDLQPLEAINWRRKASTASPDTANPAFQR